MNSRRKLIFGMAAVIIGLLSLLIGMFLFIRVSGIDALLYPSIRALDFAAILSFLCISWGVAWLITGIVFLVLGLRRFSFNSRKPMVAALALLVVFSVFSGGLLAVGLPPAPSVSVAVHDPVNYTESGSTVSLPVYVNITSTYSAYLNVSFISSNIQSVAFCNVAKGTHEIKIPVEGLTLSPGKGDMQFTVCSQSVKKIVSVNYTVYPTLSVNFSGPTSVNDANGPVCVVYSPTYQGYAPDNYSWSPGAFYFGNVQELSCNPYAQDLHITFYLNKSVSNPSGYNYTLYMSLTVTNMFGESASTGGFGEFEITVTGRN